MRDMRENPFYDATDFFNPDIDIVPLLPAEQRQRYSKPPLLMRWIAAGMLAASTLVFMRADAAATEVRSVVPPRTPPTGLMETAQRLDDLNRAPAWPGIEAPNPLAFKGAKKILKAIEAGGGPIPERVVPDAAGGISFLFFAGTPLSGGARPRYAAVTATNEGRISAVTHDRVAGLTETRSAQNAVAQRAALRRIHEFLHT